MGCVYENLRALSAATLLFALSSLALGAAAQHVETVTLTGAKRTRAATILELLPRSPPAFYSDLELLETERRISNLGIFDQVAVVRSGPQLTIAVREKWTLIPSFDLATGKTPRDLYISLGATEYNVLGTATALSVNAYREQRGWGFNVSLREHESRGHRWAFGSELSKGKIGLRFRTGEEWYDDVSELSLWSLSPPIINPHLRLRVFVTYAYHRIEEVTGQLHVPSGHLVQPGIELIWDGMRFHDLVPRGVEVSLGAGPGAFVPEAEARHFVELFFLTALPLARYTVLTTRSVAAVKNRGNANHSALLGSVTGVRGLDDALYRNWVHGYTNIELRQALPLTARLALQAVAFADAGAFQQLTARGGRGGAGGALSAGLGMRVIPTFLTGLLLRVDLARLLVPSRTWFLQFGVSQYF